MYPGTARTTSSEWCYSRLTPLLVRTADNPDGLDESAVAHSALALKSDDPQWCEDNRAPFFGARAVSTGLGDWVVRQIVDTPLPVLLDTAAAFSTTDFRAELRSFPLPTLVVHGDLDASAPIEITGRRTAGADSGQPAGRLRGLGAWPVRGRPRASERGPALVHVARADPSGERRGLKQR